MGIVEGLSRGVFEGLHSEMKNFEDPQGMRVYKNAPSETILSRHK